MWLSKAFIFRLKDVIYKPELKQLSLLFEYLDYDFKNYLDKNKYTLTPM